MQTEVQDEDMLFDILLCVYTSLLEKNCQSTISNTTFKHKI